MKNILHISKPENSSNLIGRQLIKSLLIFCVIFFVLFLIPFLRRRSTLSVRQRSDEYYERAASDWVGYLAENPIVPIAICLFVVLLYNLFLKIRNRQRKYVCDISIGQNSISIGRTDMYFREDEFISIPTQNLNCIIGVSTTGHEKKQQNVKFLDKTNGETIALIPLRDDTWFNQYSEIREALLKLDSLGVTHQETSVGFLDSIQDVFFQKIRKK